MNRAFAFLAACGATLALFVAVSPAGAASHSPATSASPHRPS